MGSGRVETLAGTGGKAVVGSVVGGGGEEIDCGQTDKEEAANCRHNNRCGGASLSRSGGEWGLVQRGMIDTGE